MSKTASRSDVLHAIPLGGASRPGPVGWSIGRRSWPLSVCAPFFNLRRRIAQHLCPKTSETIENDQKDMHWLLDAVDARLATFVATENVKRYRAMLDSQRSDADRQVITTLLVAEESRVQRLVRSSGNRSARGPAESHVQSRQWQMAL